MRIAAGFAGMSIDKAWQITPGDFWLVYDGNQRVKKKRHEDVIMPRDDAEDLKAHLRELGHDI